MSADAGDIVFQITGDDSPFRRALTGARQNGLRYARQMGVAMTAVGAAITATATKSVLDFARMGDEIGKMAARTGFSTERLSELKHAAEQGGASLNDIEKASKRLATTIFEAGEEFRKSQEKMAAAHGKGAKAVAASEKTLTDAIRERDRLQQALNRGQLDSHDEYIASQRKVQAAQAAYNKTLERENAKLEKAGTATGTYTDALRWLGLTYEDLKGQGPEEQFFKVALALAEVEDAGTRAALANEIFGRAGTQLLPMLANGAAGIQEMADEARRLGIVFDKEMAADAEGLTDEMDEVKKSITGLSFEIAKALLPAIREILPQIRDTIAGFSAWARQNPDTVASIVKLTAAAGAIMAVVGPILIALPGLVTAFAGVKAAVLGVGAAFGAIASFIGAPVAVVVAAAAGIAAAAYYVYDNWEYVAGQLAALWNWLGDVAQSLWETMKALAEVTKELLLSGVIGGVNAVVDIAANQAQQATQGGIAAAATLPGGGGGIGALGGGGVTINNLNVISTDPDQASRDLATNLALELQARGIG
jgi:hypothetical protein